MAANRFSATFMSYSKFWSAQLVKIYLVILEDPKNEQYVTEVGLTYEDIQRLILVVYAVFGDSFSVILTILTIHRIRHFQTSHEKKLIIVTASHTIIASILLIYEITKMLKFSDPISVFLADYRKTIAYFGICFNFGTILIADSRIRQDFLAIFKLSNEISVISVWSSDTN
ncbi:unnamed protein product [Caenorhabditis angaria]|uniref:Serpentine receptor class gamma n=1 Tax=Caenorhabditis angaria TaxID=860376 RepID=A0A9P1IEX6_9PELO|nr:unnamed protein product [Caenorhabditis angaria]